MLCKLVMFEIRKFDSIVSLFRGLICTDTDEVILKRGSALAGIGTLVPNFSFSFANKRVFTGVMLISLLFSRSRMREFKFPAADGDAAAGADATADRLDPSFVDGVILLLVDLRFSCCFCLSNKICSYINASSTNSSE